MMMVFLLMVFVQASMAAGITHYTLKLARTGHAELSDMWVGFKNPTNHVLAYLAGMVLTTLGVCALFVGTYVVAGLLMFVWPVLVDRKIGPIEAMRESFEMLKGEWLMATLFLFVAQLVASLGIYACYIGFVFTFPLMYIAPALLYRRFVDFAQTPPSVSPYPRGQSIAPPTEQPSAPPRPEDLR
jgi:uncharacterized membrane protein